MKCIFEINSRPQLSEPAEEKHNKLIELLKEIDPPWGIPLDLNVPFPGFGIEFTASLKLSKFLGSGIKMDVFYRYRNRLDDVSSNDDRIYIEFNSKKIDYSFLVLTVFPKLTEGFNAYTSDIFDERLIFKNYEEERGVNRRKIIKRFYPISFYDAEICRLYFKRPPGKIADMLKGYVFKAEVFNDGLLIIADTIPYTMEQSIEFEKKMKSLIRY